jgi:hypothetical protein
MLQLLFGSASGELAFALRRVSNFTGPSRQKIRRNEESREMQISTT